MRVKHDVALAPLTTLQLGGAAARLVDLESDADVDEAALLADSTGGPLFILGGGSNLVVADEGFQGVVGRMATRGVTVAREGDLVHLDVAAGESWDALVERCVGEGWSGVECLSGIPGLVGATPIQNVGAYGQEVGDTITLVHAFDRVARETVTLSSGACRFTYRHSLFKDEPRYIVLRVRFTLAADALSRAVQYAELARALGAGAGERAPLAEVRRTVLELRRAKGMVVDPSDPESVSAGSFFTNPLVDAAALAAFEARVRDAGVLGPGEAPPKFAAEGGRTKLSAGWLVERAGFAKGSGHGHVGVSRRHALALVHRGGGTTRELVDLARTIRDGVFAKFGVTLVPEPVFLGITW